MSFQNEISPFGIVRERKARKVWRPSDFKFLTVIQVIACIAYLSMFGLSVFYKGTDTAIGTAIFGLVAGIFGFVLLGSLKEGRIRFRQGHDVLRDATPRKFWGWICYHSSGLILMNSGFGWAWWLSITGKI